MPSFYSVAAVAVLASVVAAQQPQCEVIGYDSGTILAYLIHEDPALADRLACGGVCAADELCKAFAYGDGRCLLYQDALEGNVYSIETSPYTFNDLSCVAGEVEVPETPVEGEEPPAEGEAPVEETPVEGEPEGGA
ncbi:uncharacterized protein DNG_04173 [Cephalotrichum gorgonifer]|uniref:Apple domain-containing protein n=1 Tax=Cephalotrichum gorgonifer TaxID=2041049 RepID=A0AAE8SUB1_9PEZI|nr:uncharacterized protein DNG_04173 [Cephalotrichum gorgonifer]